MMEKKKDGFKNISISILILVYYKNLWHRENNKENTPDAIGSAADHSHRFANFNFNCLYVDSITE
jgi:hypothetical protein